MMKEMDNENNNHFKDIDVKSVIYSIGVIIYELFMIKIPYDDYNEDDVEDKVINGEKHYLVQILNNLL